MRLPRMTTRRWMVGVAVFGAAVTFTIVRATTFVINFVREV
jgi:hypothetical protein